jgi:hypothetical protein
MGLAACRRWAAGHFHANQAPGWSPTNDDRDPCSFWALDDEMPHFFLLFMAGSCRAWPSSWSGSCSRWLRRHYCVDETWYFRRRIPEHLGSKSPAQNREARGGATETARCC